MAKKLKKQSFTPRHAIIVSCFIAAILLVIGYVVKIRYIDRYTRAADMAETVPARELILLTAKSLKTDAVVDPQTGALYFPEAKLFLPQSQPIFGGLTYSVSLSDKNSELSVSSHGVINKVSVPLYNARNINDLYEAVPKLQSCLRGIRLLYTPISAEEFGDNKLNQTVHLNNGKDLFIYTETGCPELNDIASVLKNIQAY